jgi:hypothetical protein
VAPVIALHLATDGRGKELDLDLVVIIIPDSTSEYEEDE